MAVWGSVLQDSLHTAVGLLSKFQIRLLSSSRFHAFSRFDAASLPLVPLGMKRWNDRNGFAWWMWSVMATIMLHLPVPIKYQDAAGLIP